MSIIETNWLNKNIGLKVLIICTFLLIPILLFSQSKEALRYEIDAKRSGISYTSKDALPRGREFKRLDNTYYEGWMYEGGYKFEHAADYIGFKAAAEQFEKAMELMDHDFNRQIRTRTADVMEYMKVMKYQRDWDFITYALNQCYTNMDDPEKVWALLQKCKKADLQLEIYTETFNSMAWTVHRNRFYTSSKYPFLKNSIDENEKYANRLLDSSAQKIKRDAALNKTIFTVNYENEKMPGVWHYKSILYSYQLNIESGAYYYDKLKSTTYFPENNYATFCLIQGKFDEAEEYYKKAKTQDPGDKRMKESFYYSSILNEYKGTNLEGIDEMKELIKANGSTPGFGWYNIALARNLIYNGQIQIAKRYALRAEQFKEIHIGTTLGQSHYDFSISLINLIIKMREIEQVKFENKNWWYSPTDLSKLSQLTIEKYGLQFLMINQFATNPERDRVIYKLFSTESTVSFDEIWQLLDGFSTNFFITKFESEIKTDKRYQVKRYYKLFLAKLLMKKGKYNEAKSYLESAMNEMQVNPTYEKLFLARCNEAIILCNQELNKKSSIQKDLITLYNTYPQLIPFSRLPLEMKLHVNTKTSDEQKIVSLIKQSNIQWIESPNNANIDVYVTFDKKGAFNIAHYSVKNNQTIIIPETEFSYKTAEQASKEIIYGIFKIGNDDRTSAQEKSKKK
jgi:Tfp pilus assembly protein PilF